ncbi:MAG: MFS transporter, partial [Candidatus Kariarchaeaceae archaeon]
MEMESMVSGSGNEQGTYFSQIFTLILSVAIVMTGFGIIFPIFPQLLEIVGGGDERDLGIMAAFFGLAYLIASPIFGNVADKYGKKRVILIGLLGFSTSNLVYVYASELWQFYLARAIEGAFSSAILPPAIALTTQLTPKKVRARYIGYVVSGNTIGLIIGPLLGGVLYDGIIVNGTTLVVGSLYLPFWVSFAVGLFAFTFGVVFLPSARSMDPGLYPSKTADTEHQRIQKILEFRGTTPTVPRTLVVEEPQVPSGSIMSRLLNRQLDSLPKPLAMFFIFALADTLTVLPWLIVSPGFIFYFYGTLELTASDFGYFVAAYGLFAASGQALLGNISD